MDEPTNHLDIHFHHGLLELVRRLGVATVVVLHDLNLAARYCDRLVLLDGSGRAVATGQVADVLRPEVLEPVYGIRIQRVTADDGHLQLVFRTAAARGDGHDHGSTEEPALVQGPPTGPEPRPAQGLAPRD